MNPGGGCVEVARTFLGLGLRAFGGPSAHVGYFRDACVVRRGWLDDGGYASWVALCQFLPGPASTQLAFCLGWLRAGWLGAWVAFLAFTTPSAVLMAAVAWGLPRWNGPWADATLHGLKVAAWAVVAQAVAGMGLRLRGAPPEVAIALAAGLAAMAWPNGALQPAWVLSGALLGLWMSRREAASGKGTVAVRLRPWMAAGCLVLWAGLLAWAFRWGHGGVAGVGAALYRAGAMVFGGGHVVLPFLEESVVQSGVVTRDDFLAGYGAAQAMPGPMFTLGTYLGMRVGGWAGAVVGTAALFLPGLLLVSAVAPSWALLGRRRWAVRAVSGAGAAVLGLLAAAWLGPVREGAIQGWMDGVLGALAWGALASGRVPVLGVVAGCVAGAMGMGWIASH
jgi:chromate transporter